MRNKRQERLRGQKKSLVFSLLPTQGKRRMPPLEVLLAFAVTTAVFAFIPGPAMLYAAARNVLLRSHNVSPGTFDQIQA
jgi:hypothetical protein